MIGNIRNDYEDSDLMNLDEPGLKNVGSGKKVLSFLFFFILLAGISLSMIFYFRGLIREENYLLERQKIRTEYLSLSAWVRQLKFPEIYTDARSMLSKWYFGKLNSLYTSFPDFDDIDKLHKMMEFEYSKGRIDEYRKPKLDRAFYLTKQVYADLKEGNFKPVLTDVKECMRLDFYKIERVRIDGVDKIRLDFILWGTFGDITYKDITINVLNENGNSFSVMKGFGAPYLILDTPTNQIEDFPPMAKFGYYAIDLMPPEAVSINLNFVYDVRTFSGDNVEFTFEFGEIPVRKSWIIEDSSKWLPGGKQVDFSKSSKYADDLAGKNDNNNVNEKKDTKTAPSKTEN